MGIKECTKIFIAERISSVASADKVIVLADGHIESIGRPDEMMEKSRIYREIYEAQLKGGYDVSQ